MTLSKKVNNKKEKWYEEPVKKWFAFISGFLFVAGIGYGFAIIQKSMESKMEKFEMKQECNEKLQELIEKCKQEKQEYENRRVENLETVVKDLEKKIGKYNGK